MLGKSDIGLIFAFAKPWDCIAAMQRLQDLGGVQSINKNNRMADKHKIVIGVPKPAFLDQSSR